MTTMQVTTQKPSLGARAINAVLGPVYRLFRRPEVVEGTPRSEDMDKALSWQPSVRVQHRYGLVRWQERSDVWTLSGAKEDAPVVLYLHGGSYWHEPGAFHWVFLRKLVNRTGARVVAPLYPRAPKYDYHQTHRMVRDLWTELIRTEEPGRVLFMGDSAGGGLALSMAQELRDEHLPGPGGLVLLAPWLDVALRNPEIAVQEQVDPMLRRERILPMAAFYAKGDWDNPLVSPLFGQLKGLPPVWFFQGTYDILYPDAMQFSRKAAGEGCQLDLYVAPGMPHVYPLYPTREGAAARKEIFRIVTDFDQRSRTQKA